MTLNEYQQAARQTAIYPDDLRVVYPVIGLAGETGEVAEKVKKTLRDSQRNFTADDVRNALAKELGDVLWYLAATAGDLGLTLDEIATINLDKLHSRQARNQLHGEGDDR
ncbi:MAG: nucleoside triphosphate pyrophosphohydrolase family protein [Prevotella sp.]|nr:nucleoside triphosphate pyrophosphohydrolase family protein [Prevotella sp.]